MAIKGCEIVKRIDQRRAVLKMTRKAVATAIGLKSAQSLTDWGKGSIPQADTALYIADFLGVSIRWLLTGENDKGVTIEEQSLLDKFRRLTEQGRFEITTLIDAKLINREADELTKEEKKAAG